MIQKKEIVEEESKLDMSNSLKSIELCNLTKEFYVIKNDGFGNRYVVAGSNDFRFVKSLSEKVIGYIHENKKVK